MQEIKTKKSRKGILHDGYRYRLIKNRLNTYRCCRKTCPGYATFNDKLGFTIKTSHNHPRCDDTFKQRLSVRKEVQHLAETTSLQTKKL
jgi:hypothetical protein